MSQLKYLPTLDMYSWNVVHSEKDGVREERSEEGDNPRHSGEVSV